MIVLLLFEQQYPKFFRIQISDKGLYVFKYRMAQRSFNYFFASSSRCLCPSSPVATMFIALASPTPLNCLDYSDSEPECAGIEPTALSFLLPDPIRITSISAYSKLCVLLTKISQGSQNFIEKKFLFVTHPLNFLHSNL